MGGAVQDGRKFNGECHLRINLALPKDKIMEAFDRMDKYVFNKSATEILKYIPEV